VFAKVTRLALVGHEDDDFFEILVDYKPACHSFSPQKEPPGLGVFPDRDVSLDAEIFPPRLAFLKLFSLLLL